MELETPLLQHYLLDLVPTDLVMSNMKDNWVAFEFQHYCGHDDLAML